jgi:hypothetical protein
MNPARSKSGGVYTPASRPVSPPTRAQPFSRQPAATPADDRLHRRRLQLPERDVVEEEERERALHEDVVSAVVDEVVAHRVEPPGLDASLTFVPTPSALDTSSGARPAGMPEHAAEAAERADRAAVRVLSTSRRRRSLASTAASRSTPAAR